MVLARPLVVAIHKLLVGGATSVLGKATYIFAAFFMISSIALHNPITRRENWLN